MATDTEIEDALENRFDGIDEHTLVGDILTLEAEVAKLKKALEAWQLFDTESFDKHPAPCHIMRNQYRRKARALTEQALKGSD